MPSPETFPVSSRLQFQRNSLTPIRDKFVTTLKKRVLSLLSESNSLPSRFLFHFVLWTPLRRRSNERFRLRWLCGSPQAARTLSRPANLTTPPCCPFPGIDLFSPAATPLRKSSSTESLPEDVLAIQHADKPNYSPH